MQPSSLSRVRDIVVAGMIASLAGGGRAAAEEALAVTVALSAGDPVRGALEAIDQTNVSLATESGPRTIEVAAVRRIDSQRGEDAVVAGVSLIGSDGSRLSGTDVSWEGETVRLETSAGTVSLPVTRVQTIEWLRAGRQPGDDGRPAWLQSLPEELESDVVAVAKGDEMQCVPCAIVGITADAVRVVLDGETIPVKRERVVGLRWLREPVVGGGIIVEVSGGMLSASRVEWSPAGLVVDDEVRVPAAALRSIDYAAARTTRLAGLATDQLDVEPFFGSLADIKELAAAFRPRVIIAEEGDPRRDLLIHPRTVAVWRVPSDSRSFTTRIVPAAGVGHGALVVLAVDDREVFRGSVDEAASAAGEGLAIAAALESARRLSITVDYGRAGPVGGAVILRDPLFTK